MGSMCETVVMNHWRPLSVDYQNNSIHSIRLLPVGGIRGSMKATSTAAMRNRKRIRVIISDYCADTARWSVIHMVSLPVSHNAGNSFDKMLSSTD